MDSPLPNRDIKPRFAGIPIWSVFSYGLMAVALFLIFGPPFLGAASKPTDFTYHVDRAFQLLETGDLYAIPHFMYQVLVIIISVLLPDLARNVYGWLAVLIPYIGMGLLLYALFRRELIGSGRRWLAFFLVIVLLGLMPIIIFGDNSVCSYCNLGYLNPTTYHSPTQNTLKLWVIPVSLLGLRALHPRPYKNRRWRLIYVALAISLVTLMSFSKPNYSLSFLPALGLMALVKLVKREALDWPLLLSLSLSTLALLTFQYLLTYTGSSASVTFGFLTVMQLWNPLWQIPLKFLLSIAFPLAVYILHFDQAHRNTYLNFCWLVLGFGCVFTYLFAEEGNRLIHGNFVWTGSITLFVLMFASILFMIRQYRNQPLHALRSNWQFIVVTVIFGLHILSSIWYWFHFRDIFPLPG